MDTSKTYILMCEQAEEIQALQERGHGARCNVGKIGHRLNGAVYFFPEEPSWRDGEYRDWDKAPLSIWLPRQDQLQEMILEDFVQQEGGYLPTYWLHFKFSNWVVDFRYVTTSMEQLWLMFVMMEKYNKIWGGEKWIKIE